MGRFNRVVAIDIPHHVTQRGNGRRFVLEADADRTVYLKLLRENISLYGVALVGYCLMSDHIHLIAVPHEADGLAPALKQTHGRYAAYWNAIHQSNGHVWQGRYYSCPLDQSHLWEALRYTELNPVRAGLVLEAELWPWSSAACHCAPKEQDPSLTLEPWRKQWTHTTWREYLRAGETEARLAVIRQRTHTGRPLGTQEFIQDLEKMTQRRIALQKRGPREKIVTDRSQGELTFDP
jgi:putative transposase